MGFAGEHLHFGCHSTSHSANQQAPGQECGALMKLSVEKWSGLLKLEALGWKQMF